MFNKFEILVGLRYLKAKQKNGFVSFISLISILGITLGVAALITVLSVINGFQRDIRAKIIGVTSHMQISNDSGMLANWQNLATISESNPEVLSSAPYVDGEALISFNGAVSGALVRGIDPHLESLVDSINNNVTSGSLQSLGSGKFQLMLGAGIAKSLGVGVGDKITLITPDGQITPSGMMPRLKKFTIGAIFNTHMYEYDNSLVLINIHDAQALFSMGNSISGLRLKVKDVMQVQQIKDQLQLALPQDININTWIDQHQSYFSAVAMEKKMMFIILTLIVAVAAFNLVATLVMSVNDKKADIAILRTMGASKSNIMYIFMIQGGIAGVLGTICGTLLGLFLANYIGVIVHIIELITHTHLISGDVYLIDYLPSQIQIHDVVSIFITSIILSILATIYPSMNAAKTNPVEALRYE